MVVNQLLKIGVESLKKLEYIDPILEARLILTFILDEEPIYVYINGNQEVDFEKEEKFLQLIDLRQEGYPLQYILNNANFMGIDFYVEEGVLIPRSDTEVLVEYILDYIDKKQGEIKLLDIGIGSGAIVLSSKYHRPSIEAYGIDIEEKPLEVTSKNIARLGLEGVNLFKGDLFEPIDGPDYYSYFDIIASNPPYINSDEIVRLQREVKDHEPMKALDGGKDGMDYYKRIVVESRKYLKDGALLILEIGYDQGERVKNLFEENGFDKIEVLKDIQGLDRVVLGYK